MKMACVLLAAAALYAQRPEVENAKVETRVFAGPLANQLAQFGPGPFWAGYAEPTTPGRRGNMCNLNQTANTPIRLEGETHVVMLVRVANGHTDELRVVSPDCRLDAGGLPFHWIENVPPAESVAWLKANGSEHAMMAIALHAGSDADKALEDLTSPNQPERVREKAAFWIGNSRGASGLAVLNRMLASDPSEHVREQAIFALNQSREPAALTRLVEAARTGKDPRIRSKALFWLAQKAGSLQTIRDAASSDPELSVKEQAVFALKQMPNSEGVPALIDVARNHKDPAVRKKAMFWLGQSNDPRAVDFFAQVLKQ